MEDALPFFAMAALAWGLAMFAWVAGRVWLRAKELELTTPTPLNPNDAASLAAILAQIEARLRHMEAAVDATAVEVERLAEMQRFAARALAAGTNALPDTVRR